MSEKRRSGDVDDTTALRVMEEAAGRMGLAMIYRNLDDDEINISSGMCRLQDKRLLIVDRRLDTRGRWRAIANAIKTLEHEDMYLPPLARELMDTV